LRFQKWPGTLFGQRDSDREGRECAGDMNPQTFLTTIQEQIMELLALTAMPMAAAGYSLVYLLAGGGLFGAIVIFFIAKMLGQ
jgi:hypothetical protein